MNEKEARKIVSEAWRQEYYSMQNTSHENYCIGYLEGLTDGRKEEREKAGGVIEASRKAYIRIMGALFTLGMYPKAWEGEYDKRSKVQGHWNQSVMKLTRRIGPAKKAFEEALNQYRKKK